MRILSCLLCGADVVIQGKTKKFIVRIKNVSPINTDCR